MAFPLARGLWGSKQPTLGTIRLKWIQHHHLKTLRTTRVQNRHYDQWEYLPEKTEALETRQNFLRKIFENEG